MRRWGVGCAVVIGLAGCGGSQQATSTAPMTVTETVTASTSTPSVTSTTRTTTSVQSYQPYSASDYSFERPSGWNTEEDQTARGTLVESKWRDPSNSTTSVLIDTLPSPGSSAQADAASVRAQTSSTPGYQEISFGPSSISGNDGWKWVFKVSGTQRVDYFVNVCGTSFAILGATSPQRFDQLAGTFQHVADSLQPTCTTTSTTTDTTTTSVPPPLPSSCPTEPGVTRDNDCPPADPSNPPTDFCTTHQCIDNFYSGRGTAVQCNDGEWSMSGGIQGACSYHRGESNNPPGPPPSY